MSFSVSLNVRHAGCRYPSVKSCNPFIVYYCIIHTNKCTTNVVTIFYISYVLVHVSKQQNHLHGVLSF